MQACRQPIKLPSEFAATSLDKQHRNKSANTDIFAIEIDKLLLDIMQCSCIGLFFFSFFFLFLFVPSIVRSFAYLFICLFCYPFALVSHLSQHFCGKQSSGTFGALRFPKDGNNIGSSYSPFELRLPPTVKSSTYDTKQCHGLSESATAFCLSTKIEDEK